MLGPPKEAEEAKPGDDVAPVAVPVSLAQMPHHGRIFLDEVGDKLFQLTDIVSGERVVLPLGEWALQFDDEASPKFAVLVDMENPEANVRCVEDRLQKDIFAHLDGERFLVSQADRSTRRSLDDMLARYRSAEVVVRLGPSSARAVFLVHIMAMPRACSARVFWQLPDLYKACSMTSFAKQPSKWSHHVMLNTGKKMANIFKGERFLLSRHSNISKKNAEEVPWWSRCLPAPRLRPCSCC